MNIVVLKSNLKSALWSIAGGIKESANLNSIKGFLLEAKDGQVKLSSTDLEIGIICLTSAKVIEEGSGVIPFSIFSQIINNLTSERINLETKNNNLLITTDNYRAKITLLPKEDYPIIPQIESKKDNLIEIDRIYLMESLSNVSGVCQVSSIRPELSGIFFIFDENESKIVATDSFRLAEKTISKNKFTFKFSEKVSFIVPLRTVNEIVKVFSQQNDSKIFILYDNNQVSFESEKIKIISRLIEGKFPDYEMIIPKSFETEILIEKDELIEALKLTGSLSNRLFEIKFTIDDNLKKMTIFSSSQDFGENEYILPAKIKGQPITITFNWKFVIDGLKNIKSNQVLLGFNGEEKPALIKSTEDDSYLYILMPIRSS